MVNDELRSEIIPMYKRIVRDLEHGAQADFKLCFFDLHNYDQAKVYQALPPQLRHQLIEWIDPIELADVFDLIDPEVVEEDQLLSEMTPRYAADVLNEMYVDNAVDVLDEMPEAKQEHYLQQLSDTDAKELRNLLIYEEQTAGALMTPEYVAINAQASIGEALNLVKQLAEESEQISYIYVVENEKLIGVISLRSLIIHPDHEKVQDVMTQSLVTVQPNDDQEIVARLMADYDLVAIPVVSEQNKMLGIIMIDDILDVIEAENAEDYERFAGVHNLNLEESPFQSIIKRLPWLIILVFLGLGTASIINHYDRLVQQMSVLAVFISLITGTAGNAGTQSLAVSIRRITLKEKKGIFIMFLTELLIGLSIGLITGGTILLVVWVWKANFLLGLAVGLAMAGAITVANLAGAFVPLLMESFKIDPAVASGPFISTLSDLTSVIIYFNIANWILNVWN